MNSFDRIHEINRVFTSHRYPVSMQTLCDELECSRATVTRLLGVLRDYLGAPIYNVRGKGWRYDQSSAFELPGMWFTAEELEALLSIQQLLTGLQPGLLDGMLRPMRRRIEKILTRAAPLAGGEIARIRILSMQARNRPLPHFRTVAAAVLERNRLVFAYAARSSGETTRREVSPQRLVHYRDNWYLDAFCHLRDDLRTFSLDCISEAKQTSRKAKPVSETVLNRKLGAAYGIFAGDAAKTAVLRFTPERAMWVAHETWHPEQQGRWMADGRYELRIPYGNPAELVLDICRYGPDVEVVAPESLRQAVAERLRKAAAQYI